MAKMSALDKAIAIAQDAFDEAEMAYRMAGGILMALKAAKTPGEFTDAQKVKRGRPKKALIAGKEVTI
jgi:hypothetical protein